MIPQSLCVLMVTFVLCVSGAAWARAPDLPPEIQFDLLVQQLAAEIEQERWEQALGTIDELKSGPFEPPQSFLHFEGKANLFAGNANKAEEAWLEYLRVAGREGKYYREALSGVVEARAADAYIELADGEFLDCGGCPAMTTVPAGMLKKGTASGEGAAIDAVEFDGPFAISKHEITFGQYEKFVAASGYQGSRNCKVFIRTESGDRVVYEPRSDRSWRNSSSRVSDTQPVSCVSWHDARAYAAWLSETTGHSYRLPTADEWEYAARGGAETPWHCGDDPACVDAVSWNRTNRKGMYAEPVGTRRPNAWGLHDVHGNLWEWVEDCRSSTSEDGCERRRILGGGFLQLADLMRLDRRRSNADTDSVDALIGFRILRELP